MTKPIHIGASWLLTSNLIGWSLFSTPYMKKVISGEAVESAGSAYLAFAVGAVVCGWPWLLASKSLRAPEKASGATTFLVVSVVIAALFVIPVSSAPVEGVGIYVLLCIALVWAAYPLCRVVGRVA